MSQKHPGKLHPHGASPDAARRLVAKGNLKDALKEARLCFRAGETAENRQLLEEIYLARIQQLHRFSQVQEAKSVFSDLQKLGPRNAEVRQGMDRMRILLGESGGMAGGVLEPTPELLIEMADQAILNDRATVPKYGDLPVQVAAVRDALVAVSRGDDDRARELLKSIPRTSPLADWKLLIRGLEAFYARDDARVEANWSRLDITRPASRIARTLQAAAGQLPATAGTPEDPRIADGLLRLSANSPSSGFVNALEQLTHHWYSADRMQFLDGYQRLKQTYGRSHPAQIRQIVDFVWKWAVRSGADRLLDRLMRIGPAPELDPNWNRARALLEEDGSSVIDIDDLRAPWLAYLEDLPQITCLSAEDRTIARALVLRRLARHCLAAGKYFLAHEDGIEFEDDEEPLGNTLSEEAIQYFRESIAAWPQLETSYLELAGAFESRDDSESAVAAMQELAERNPDQFEAASWLSRYYLAQNEPGKADPFVATVRRLRPRDPQIVGLVWQQTLAMIRHLTLKRDFDAARRAAEDAAAVTPPDAIPGTLAVLRAGIEFRAANQEAGRRILQDAMQNLPDPAVVWMQISSLAARLSLQRGLRKDFDERLKVCLAEEPSGETAGQLSRFLLDIRRTHASYVGRATHERQLTAYLRRALRICWQSADLKAVCEFLADGGSRQTSLRRAFLDIGMDFCPTTPQFFLWAAQENLDPFSVARRDYSKSEELLSTAVSLHESGAEKLTAEQYDSAMSLLSEVRDLIDTLREIEGSYEDEDDEFDDDDDDDFDSDDDDGDSDADDGDAAASFGRSSGFHWSGGSHRASTARQSMPDFRIPDEFRDADGQISEAGIAMLARVFESTMPPEIRREVAKVARQQGISEKEAIASFAKWMVARSLESADASPDGGPAKRQTGATRQRRR